jgi:23S rRNA pseudouridine2605 synthase
MRLQRALARAGVASRRAAEELIRGGRVRVNGKRATLGMSVDPVRDSITVGDRRVAPPKTAWFALHKPLGCVVSRGDAQGRQTVFELVPRIPGLTYAGRLDVMTSGLLLLTTDGAIVHRLTHPRFAVERTYQVHVHGRSQEEIRGALAAGVWVEDRRVAIVRYHLRPAPARSVRMTLVLAEGRNRIVRRLCEQVHLKVERLVRTTHGPIRLGRLAPGEWRRLTEGELRALRALGAASRT